MMVSTAWMKGATLGALSSLLAAPDASNVVQFRQAGKYFLTVSSHRRDMQPARYMPPCHVNLSTGI